MVSTYPFVMEIRISSTRLENAGRKCSRRHITAPGRCAVSFWLLNAISGPGWRYVIIVLQSLKCGPDHRQTARLAPAQHVETSEWAFSISSTAQLIGCADTSVRAPLFIADLAGALRSRATDVLQFGMRCGHRLFVVDRTRQRALRSFLRPVGPRKHNDHRPVRILQPARDQPPPARRHARPSRGQRPVREHASWQQLVGSPSSSSPLAHPVPA